MARTTRGETSLPGFGDDLIAALRRCAIAHQSEDADSRRAYIAIALADAIAWCVRGHPRTRGTPGAAGSAIAKWIGGGAHPGGFSFADACRAFELDAESLRVALRIALGVGGMRAVKLTLPRLPAPLRDYSGSPGDSAGPPRSGKSPRRSLSGR